LLVIVLALVFVVVGLIFLVALPWVGIPLAFVGLVLAVIWTAGFARRGIRGRNPAGAADHGPREDA
jgi:hypothetical protein